MWAKYNFIYKNLSFQHIISIKEMINQVSSSFSNLKSLKQQMKYFIFHKIHIFHKRAEAFVK